MKHCVRNSVVKVAANDSLDNTFTLFFSIINLWCPRPWTRNGRKAAAISTGLCGHLYSISGSSQEATRTKDRSASCSERLHCRVQQADESEEVQSGHSETQTDWKPDESSKGFDRHFVGAL